MYNQLTADQMKIDDMLMDMIDSDLPQDGFTIDACCSTGIQLNSYSKAVRRWHASRTIELMETDGYCLVVAYSKAADEVFEGCRECV